MPRYPEPAPSVASLRGDVFSALAARAAASERKVYPLHVGDTWMDPLPAARAEAQRSADHPRLHNYAPVQGEPALLSAVVAHLERRGGRTVPRERVQVVCGATSGLSVALQALVSPGEEVILLSPFWPLIRGIIAKRGARAVEVPFMDRYRRPAFDAERVLEAAVTEHTTAIYVNSPHNPTGHVLDEATAGAIARVAARHNLWVLSDEVYEALHFDEPPPAPLWARPDFSERIVAVHSLSKAYGLAGARVGFVHGPASAMGPIRAVQTYATYCAPRPMQLGAACALRDGGAWLAEARASYRKASRMAAEALGIAPPQGGTFVFFDAEAYLRPGEDTLGLLERCLDEGVLLTPGAACGQHFPTWLRLSFTSVPPQALAEALHRVRRVLSR